MQIITGGVHMGFTTMRLMLAKVLFVGAMIAVVSSQEESGGADIVPTCPPSAVTVPAQYRGAGDPAAGSPFADNTIETIGERSWTSYSMGAVVVTRCLVSWLKMNSRSINRKSLMRSSFSCRSLHLTVGYTAGNLFAAEGPFFFLSFLILVRGLASNFFFLGASSGPGFLPGGPRPGGAPPGLPGMFPMVAKGRKSTERSR